ncbi:MAG: hypothetical protein ACRDAU_11630 [Clostridium sp.]
MYQNGNINIAECLNKNADSNIICKYKIEIESIYDNEYIDIKIFDNKLDYRNDVKLSDKKIVKICGDVKSTIDECLENKIVILYREIQRGYNIEVIEVARAITDSMGMFMFIELYSEENTNYRVKLA